MATTGDVEGWMNPTVSDIFFHSLGFWNGEGVNPTPGGDVLGNKLITQSHGQCRGRWMSHSLLKTSQRSWYSFGNEMTFCGAGHSTVVAWQGRLWASWQQKFRQQGDQPTSPLWSHAIHGSWVWSQWNPNITDMQGKVITKKFPLYKIVHTFMGTVCCVR